MSVFQGASVGVTLTANKSRYSKELKAARAEMRDWQRTVDKSMGRASGAMRSFAKAGALALGAGLALSIREGINELNDMQKANAQTAAGLKSTGGVANVTAKQITNLSNALMLKSGVDDQAIQTGANLLLTFTKVRNEAGKGNDVFNQATQAALDLSVKGFGSMESTSKMLGKALQDPVKGVTALSRAGVTFTQTQKDQIAAMVESGNQLGAQKLILAELRTQVGGAAEAYGNTLAGKIGIAREQFAGISAEIVGRAVPSFLKLLDATQRTLTQFDAWSKTTQGRAAIADVGRVVLTAGRAFQQVTSFLVAHRTAVTNLAIGYGAFRVINGILTPLNAAWQLGQVRAAQFAAANAAASRSAILSRGALAALGGPLGLVSAALAVGTVAYVAYRNKLANVETQADRTGRAIRGVGNAMRDMNNKALEFDEARVNKKIALAGLTDARARLKAATKGTTEYRDALLAVEQAEIGVRRANDQVKASRNAFNKSVEKTTAAHAKAKAEAAKERAGIRALESQLSAATKARKTWLTSSNQASDAEKKLVKELKQARERLTEVNSKLDRTADATRNMSGKTDAAATSWRNLASAIREADSAAANYDPPAPAGARPFARSARGVKKGASRSRLSGLASRVLGGARSQLAIDADAGRAAAQAAQQFAAADKAVAAAVAAANRKGLNATQKAAARDRLATARQNLSSAGSNLAAKEQAARDAVIQSQLAAAQAAEDAARAAEEAAEAQRLAAEAQRQAELDIPRTAMTLTDAVRDLERAQAEATVALEDDLAVSKAALADEQRRQSLIQQTLARADLSEAERADLLGQLAASVRAVTGLQGSVAELSASIGTQAGGATLDDLLKQLTATTQAIYAMGATEAGNVFSIAKLEQVVTGGGVDFWELQTTAELQGSVGV